MGSGRGNIVFEELHQERRNRRVQGGKRGGWGEGEEEVWGMKDNHVLLSKSVLLVQ